MKQAEHCGNNYVEENASISVVIATLGGDSLPETIAALNRSTVVPSEILVCIPQQYVYKVANLNISNVKLIVTECKGQVAQRVEGFRSAIGPLVLQIDDDMLPETNCLDFLRKTILRIGPSASVAPTLIDRKNGLSAYKKPVRSPIFLAIYYWLMNGQEGYVPGKIDKAGNAVGVDYQLFENVKLVETEWLAGGCILHYKPNLIINNYFPFPGKAYCEDIIHSHLLTQSGINLVVDIEARCQLDLIYASTMDLTSYIRNLRSDWRARRYTMSLRGKSSLRILLIYIFSAISYFSKKVFSNFKLLIK